MNSEQPSPSYSSASKIYWQAGPLLANTLDVYDLFTSVTVTQLFDQLTATPVTATFDIERTAFEATLFSLFFSEKNKVRYHGQTSCHIGFPVCTDYRAGELIQMPLLLWPVQLRLKKGGAGSGQIRLVSAVPKLNPFLPDDYRQRWGDDASAILSYLRKNKLPEHPVSLRQIGLETENGQLVAAGIIGLFDPPGRLFSTQELPDWNEKPPLSAFSHPFAHLPLDPAQRSAAENMSTAHRSVVTGQAGSGKQHLLRHMIVNALSNGKTVLLISEQQHRLYEIQEHLHQLGLGKLSHILGPGGQNAYLLAERLRAECSKDRFVSDFDRQDFRRLLDEQMLRKKKTDTAYRSTHRLVFDNRNWQETVGFYLKASRSASKELLGGQTRTLDIPADAYQVMEAQIEEAAAHYRQVKTLRHPLRKLNRNLFLQMDEQEAQVFAEQKLSVFNERFSRLLQRYRATLDTYRDSMQNYFLGAEKELDNLVSEIQYRLETGSSQYGNDFRLTSQTSLKLYGVFSKKIQQIQGLRAEAWAYYSTLCDRLNSLQLFEFTPRSQHQLKGIPQLEQELQRYQEAKARWKSGLPEFMQQEMHRLNSKTGMSELELNTELTQVEHALDIQLDDVNKSGLFAEAFTHNMLTLEKRQQFLEDVLDVLASTLLNLRDFGSFYHWQRFWLDIPERSRTLIRGLVRLPVDSWVSVFRTWYANERLQLSQSLQLPDSELPFKMSFVAAEELSERLPAQLLNLWENRQQSFLQQLKRTDRELLRKVAGSTAKETVFEGENLQPQTYELLTELLPVLLCDAVTAAELFVSAERPLFDLLLFEGAQYIDAHLGQSLDRLGRRVVLAGNRQFIEDDDKLDLLEVGIQADFPIQELTRIYRYYPANLQQLQAGRSIVKTSEAPFKLTYQEVDGYYDEHTKENRPEAERLLFALNQIKPTPQRTYPTLAIVCLTTAQRDLTGRMLQTVKQSNPEQAELIRQLERNGLHLLALDELQGQRAEHMLLSTTFGPSGTDGSLTSHLRFLHSKAGARQLNELMAVAQREITVFSSLPLSQVPKSNPLKNYLLMIQALSENNGQHQEALMTSLPLLPEEDEDTDTRSELYDELALRLQQFLPAQRIVRDYQEGPFSFPLIVKAANDDFKKYVLIPDGTLAKAPFTDAAWEYSEQKRLLEKGYQTLPFWTLNLWKRTAEEIKRIAEKIADLDAE